MKSVKNFYDWLSEREEEGFSSQLLRTVRDAKENVDIRDVRELLHLGADPNYKLLGHSDEEYIDKIKDIAREEEWDLRSVPDMRVFKMSTLAYPIFRHSPELLEVMLEYGADPNLDFSDITMTAGAATPFMYAVAQADKNIPSSMKVLDLLVKNGADVNVVDSRGNNALHREILGRNFDLVPMLIELGVNPHTKNKDGVAPIDLIDPWSKYVIDGDLVSGSEARARFKDVLGLPEEPKSKDRFFFRKNK